MESARGDELEKSSVALLDPFVGVYTGYIEYRNKQFDREVINAGVCCDWGK